MSNYVPRTRKKRERQEWLENKLRRLVARGASPGRLMEAAEEVRAARIRTIKSDRQHCWAIGSTARYDAEIAALESVGADVILGEFLVSPNH